MLLQLFFVIVLIFAGTAPARALDYYGGSGDGYGKADGANAPWITVQSAVPQAFTIADAATAMSAVTVTQYLTPAGSGITAASGLRLVIPAGLAMTWDTGHTTATLTGSGAGKVSATVSYPDNKTLALTVSSDFADGEAVVVSGLYFKSFTASGSAMLGVSIDGGATITAQDPNNKLILYPVLGAGTYGGNGDGYAAAGFADHVYGFTGGTGKGDASFLFGSRAVMALASAADQTFTTSDAPTSASAVTITQNYAPAGQGVQAAKGIRVKIPSALGMTWNTALTSATVAGTAAGKVSGTVSYENGGKTLLITVNSNFVDGDTITVSGLAFNNFTSSCLTWLGLEIANDGTTLESDPFYKQIFALTRTRGFTGGSGKGDAVLVFRYDATGVVLFSTLF